MAELKREFLIGFSEGWESFWSPFVGLFNSLQVSWKRHVHFHQSSDY